MPASSKTLRIARLRLFSRVAGITVCCLSLAVLVGWFWNIAVLKSVVPGWSPMKVNTALGMLGAGLALWLRVVDPQNKTTRIAATGLATCIIVLGSLTALEELWAVDFHIDQLFFFQPASTGHPRSGPHVAGHGMALRS